MICSGGSGSWRSRYSSLTLEERHICFLTSLLSYGGIFYRDAVEETVDHRILILPKRTILRKVELLCDLKNVYKVLASVAKRVVAGHS